MFETEKKSHTITVSDPSIMGRPEIPLDWAKIDRLLSAGCPGTEVASHFNIHPDTLYNRVQEKYGVTFTAYSAEKKQKGHSLVRVKQFYKAVDGEGDTSMLIWLGKNLLGQRDSHIEQQAPHHELLSVLLSDIKSLKEKLEEVEKIRFEENKALSQDTAPKMIASQEGQSTPPDTNKLN
jgi:hypothetical protein